MNVVAILWAQELQNIATVVSGTDKLLLQVCPNLTTALVLLLFNNLLKHDVKWKCTAQCAELSLQASQGSTYWRPPHSVGMLQSILTS